MFLNKMEVKMNKIVIIMIAALFVVSCGGGGGGNTSKPGYIVTELIQPTEVKLRHEQPHKLQVDDSGSLFVFGRVFENGSSSRAPFFIAKLNQNGTLDQSFDGESGVGDGVLIFRNDDFPSANVRQLFSS